MTTHKTTIVGKCPLGCADIYEATFTIFGRVLPVEEIREAIAAATAEPIYQESLGQRLANALDCTVTITGRHSEFNTESVSNPEPR